MSNAFGLKNGDEVIYIDGYTIFKAHVVGESRIKYLFANYKLDNGSSLSKGSKIYDTIEEAKSVVLEKINDRIMTIESEIELSNQEIENLNKIKSDLK